MIEKLFLKIWYNQNSFYIFFSIFFLPLSFIYLIIFYSKTYFIRVKRFNTPILCVGNINVGGTGKTSTLLSLLPELLKNNPKLVILLRGYKGKIKTVHKVNPNKDSAINVGDEALMYADIAKTYISSNRAGAINEIISLESPDIIVLDDGFQDRGVHKDKNIILINGDRGLGNNLTIPSGPLREIPSLALKRADIIIFIGKDKNRVQVKYKELFDSKLIFNGNIRATNKNLNQKYLAFSGIGNNQSFIDTLVVNNFNVVDTILFPDHYQYSNNEIKNILNMAKEKGLIPITTEKDMKRIASEFKDQIQCFKIKIIFENQESLLNEIQKLKS